MLDFGMTLFEGMTISFLVFLIIRLNVGIRLLADIQDILIQIQIEREKRDDY